MNYPSYNRHLLAVRLKLKINEVKSQGKIDVDAWSYEFDLAYMDALIIFECRL